MTRHFFRLQLVCWFAFVSLCASGFGQSSYPRLALQYWMPEDKPDRPYGHIGPVWVEGHNEDDPEGSGHFEDQDNDGNDDTWVPDQTWVSAHYEDQWIQDGVLPDGAYGSSWSTSAGSFNINSADSTYASSSVNRGYLNHQLIYNQVVSIKIWAAAPSNNCSSFSYTVYMPNGGIAPNADNLAPNSGNFTITAPVSTNFATRQYGLWRIDVRFSGATGVASASGTVSYYFYVGPAPQTISFPTISRHSVGDAAFDPGAIASSGLPVVYTVAAGAASIVNGAVLVTGNGLVVIHATQPGGQVGGTVWSPAGLVERTIVVSGTAQTISFPVIGNHAVGDAFLPGATATSGLPVSYTASSGVVFSGSTATLTNSGNITITASQAGNETYGPAPSVSRTFTVAPDTTAPTAPSGLVATTLKTSSFTLSWTASTDYAGVTQYEVQRNGTAIGTSATPLMNLTGLAAGTSSSFAVRARDASGNWSALSTPLSVTTVAYMVPRLALQYWTAGDYPNRPYGHTYQVWIEGHDEDKEDGSGHYEDRDNDGEDDTWVADTEWVPGHYEDRWMEDGVYPDGQYGSLWTTSTGTYKVTDASGSAAISDRGSLITSQWGGMLAVRFWYDAPSENCNTFVVNYNAASGSWQNGPGGVNVGYSGFLDWQFWPAAGAGVITPQYAGATNVTPINGSVVYHLTVGPTQTVTFPVIPNHALGDAPLTLSATASSGLPVSYRVISGPATLSGTTLTLTGEGTVVVCAYQAGGTNGGGTWTADSVTRTFTVQGSPQTISFPSIADCPYGTALPPLAATATSGLPVTFSVASGPATISGNAVTLTGVGAVTITANQPGAGLYGPAQPVSRTFTVTKGAQTINFPSVAGRMYGDAPFAVSASASSGLPVTLTVTSGPAAISGSTVTLTGPGTVVLTAAQAGNTNYNAASLVSQTFASGRLAGYFYVSVAAGSASSIGGPPGTVINLTAATPPPGSGFTGWAITAGAGTLASPQLPLTTLTLTSSDVTVSASSAPFYALIVQNGTAGLSSAQEGAVINLAATADTAAQIFSNWTIVSGPGSIDDPKARSPKFTVGPGNTVARANYISPHLLSVVLGSGTAAGSGGIRGTSIQITPATAPIGTEFDGWMVVGSAGMVTEVVNPDTTKTHYFIMGNNDGMVLGWFIDPAYRRHEIFAKTDLAPGTLTTTGTATLTVRGFIVDPQLYDVVTDIYVERSFDYGESWLVAPEAWHGSQNGSKIIGGSYSSTTPGTVIYRGRSRGLVNGDSAGSGMLFTSMYSYARAAVLLQGSLEVRQGTANPLGGPPGTVVTLDALVPPGNVFTRWRLDSGVGVIADMLSPHTTFTMQEGGAIVQAEYIASYPLTVQGGTANKSGGIMGTVVNITANPLGGTFVGWSFDGINETAGVIADPSAANTTFTMGNRPATVRANFAGTTLQHLSLFSATVLPTTGLTGLTGTTVTLTADRLPGYFFDGWRFNSTPRGMLGNAASRVTTYTYGLGDDSLEPNYTAGGVLEVQYGIADSDGGAPGKVISIHPMVPEGNAFTDWVLTSGAGTIATPSAANTTFTMGTGNATVRANYAPASVPVITPGTPTATVGVTFSYTIIATNMGSVGSNYTVSALPPGLTVNHSTGAISGKTYKAGTYNLTVTATNSNGADTKPMVLTVAAAGQTITFPAIANKSFGVAPFQVTATASSGLPPTFSVQSGPASVAGNIVTLTGAGTVTIKADQAGNANFSAAAPVSRSFTVTGGSSGSSAKVQPARRVVGVAQSTSFSIDSSLGAPDSYQWRKGGVNLANGGHISGATDPMLTINSATATDAGSYDVVLHFSWGNPVAVPATLVVTNASSTADTDEDGLSDYAQALINPPGTATPETYGAGIGNSATSAWPAVNSTKTDTVGKTDGVMSVGVDGAASYTIPIYTPPGVSGVQPSLALQYSSNGPNGALGAGWSLSGLSTITRGPSSEKLHPGADSSTDPVDFDDNDRFFLDGNRLMVVSGSYGADESEYRTAQETFSKIVYHTTATTSWFKVWTKSGLVLEYGNTADSRIPGVSSNSQGWQLNRTQDRAGNYYTVTYSTGSGAHYPLPYEIKYTGTTQAEPFQIVRFGYEARGDLISWYRQGGGKIYIPKRMSSIDVIYLTTPTTEKVVRRYSIAYETSSFSTRSRLKSVQEEGIDGAKLPATVFDWSNDTIGFTQAASGTFLYTFGDAVYFGDFNGDGLTDMFEQYGPWTNSYGAVFLSNGSEFVAPSSPVRLNGNSAYTWGSTLVGDINGDGFCDVIMCSQNKNDFKLIRYVWLGSSAGLSATPINIDEFTQDASTHSDGVVRVPRYLLADTESSGRADLVELQDAANGSSAFDIYRFNDATQKLELLLTPERKGTSALKAEGDIRVADLNGDGIPEFLNLAANVSAVAPFGYNWLGLNNGIWASDPANLEYRFSTREKTGTLSRAADTIYLADLNGDNMTDMLIFQHFFPNITTAYAISGSSTYMSNQGATWLTDNKLTMIDLNRDGCADLIRQRSATSEIMINVPLSDGSRGFTFKDQLVITGGPKANELCIPIDFNGDGRLDLFIRNDFNPDDPKRNGNTANGWRVLTATPSAAPSDVITTVTDSLGATVKIQYAPLTDSTVYTKGAGTAPAGMANVQLAAYVVKKVTVDLGSATTVLTGGTFQTADSSYDLTYKYEGLRSAPYRGALGFEIQAVTDSRTQLTTRIERRQDYPYIGFVKSVSTSRGAIKLSETVSEPKVTQLNSAKTYFVYPMTSTTKTWGISADLTTQGDLLSEVLTDQTVDDWGNTTDHSIDYKFEGRTLTASVAPLVPVTSTDNWILDRIEYAKVTAVATGHTTRKKKITVSYEDETRPWLVTKTVSDTDPSAATTKLTTEYKYTDSFGHLNKITTTGRRDATVGSDQSRTLEIRYDDLGRFVHEVERKLPAVGSRAAITFTETFEPDHLHGRLGKHTDANSLDTTFSYDEFSRLKTVTSSGVTTEIKRSWTSDPSGVFSVETLASYADGSATRHVQPPSFTVFDRIGRVQRSAGLNADGHPTWRETRYDTRGLLALMSQPYRQLPTDADLTLEPDYDPDTRTPHVYWTQVSYDAMGRPSTSYYPNTTEVSQSYAGLAVTTTVTAPKSAGGTVTRKRRTVYDPLGRIASIYNNEALGDPAERDTISYAYDALGNITTTTAAGVATTTAYDYRGLPVSLDDPNIGHRDYAFNAFGELYQVTDAKAQIMKLDYDALGRVLTRVEPEGTTTWSYDSLPGATPTTSKGMLHKVTGPDGTATGTTTEVYAYDSLNRLASYTRTIGAADFAMIPGYDGGSRVETIRYDSPGARQQTFKYVFNTLGYTRELRDMDAGSGFTKGQILWALQSVNSSGQPAREIYGNGTRSWSGYSQTDGLLRRRQVFTDQIYFENFGLDVDGLGQVEKRTMMDGNNYEAHKEEFGNDLLGRLTSITRDDIETASTQYAADGNITTKSGAGDYTYLSERVAATGTEPAKYRPNAVSKTTQGTVDTTYEYDANGNMTKRNGAVTAEWLSFDQPKKLQRGAAWSEFLYGVDHERTQHKNSAGDTTTYVDGTHEYVQGASTRYRYHLYGPAGSLVELTWSGTQRDLKFFATDHLGSIEAISDDKGSLLEGLAYEAWGGRRQTDWTSGTPTRQTTVNRGFTGHEMLDDLGLVHMRGRIYDPVIARFLRPDPVIASATNAQSYNPYSYVANSPLNGTDPSGYEPNVNSLADLYTGGQSYGLPGMSLSNGGNFSSSFSFFGILFSVGPSSYIGSVPYLSPIATKTLGGYQTGGHTQGQVVTNVPAAGNATATGQGVVQTNGVYAPPLLRTPPSSNGPGNLPLSRLPGFGSVASATVSGTLGAGSMESVAIGGGSLAASALWGGAVVVNLDRTAPITIGGFDHTIWRFRRLVDAAALRGFTLESSEDFDVWNQAYAMFQAGHPDIAQQIIDDYLASKLRRSGIRPPGGTAGKTALEAVQFHHAWPKYLGGRVQQILEPLPKSLHKAFHQGLDDLFPRWKGTKHYESLSPSAQRQMLQDLGDYTKAFDKKHGTQLYDAMIREGFLGP
jgi:RHS repeat-associated protein